LKNAELFSEFLFKARFIKKLSIWKSDMAEKIMHWADAAAQKIIHEKGDKELYVCASGISPSGTVHFGNFRELITTDLVVRALGHAGKNVRFIYSWDNYDRFRKVPGNVAKEWDKFVGMPYSDIPDPFKCHENYAEHFEQEFENSIKGLGFNLEFIRQAERYKKCVYAEDIKKAMDDRKKIIEILDKYRKEPLEKEWNPLMIYCEKCGKDSTSLVNYDGEYTVEYDCECGYHGKANFKEKGIVKLTWRVDWPMRWHYEKVDFEPGGKDHSTPGSSRTTGKEIVEQVWRMDAPIYQMYDFIILKGLGGKMSGSSGNVITVAEVLEVYEPSIVRYMFAGTRPNVEFAVSFDSDVLKVYEDFDKCERIYFDRKEAKDEKEYLKYRRIYELSCTGKVPSELPYQPSFRHLSNILQVYDGNTDEAVKYYSKELKTEEDEERFRLRAKCCLNWLNRYAPKDMKFRIQNHAPEMHDLNEKQIKALKKVAAVIEDVKSDDQLHEKFYGICKELELSTADFFKAAYKVLIDKEKGPRLANFMLIIGKDRVKNLIDEL
jgi:lysyl-tRNA synthetase class 1